MQSHLDTFNSTDAVVIAISVDPVETNRKLATDLDLRFSVLSDPDLTAIDAYGMRHPGGNRGADISRPATFVLDRDGLVRWRNLAENIRLRPRPEQILEQLYQIP